MRWDVDQFDHWELPTPNGPWWVDFGCRKPNDVYGEDAYRVMWPFAEAGEPAWTVWRQDDNGVKVEVARYDREDVAKALVAQLERHPTSSSTGSPRRHPRRTYRPGQR